MTSFHLSEKKVNILRCRVFIGHWWCVESCLQYILDNNLLVLPSILCVSLTDTSNTHVNGFVWMGLALWDMRSCPSALVPSVSLHHSGHGNVTPVWECWDPEFSAGMLRGPLFSRRQDDLGRTSRSWCPALHPSVMWLQPTPGGPWNVTQP